jgi:hypothetical protein
MTPSDMGDTEVKALHVLHQEEWSVSHFNYLTYKETVITLENICDQFSKISFLWMSNETEILNTFNSRHQTSMSCKIIPYNCIHNRVTSVHIQKGTVIPVLNQLSTMPWRRTGSGCIDPHILDLGTRERWVVSFTPWPLSSRERAPGTHQIGGRADPRAGLDTGEEKNLLHLPGIKTQFLSGPPHGPSLYWLSWL